MESIAFGKLLEIIKQHLSLQRCPNKTFPHWPIFEILFLSQFHLLLESVKSTESRMTEAEAKLRRSEDANRKLKQVPIMQNFKRQSITVF